MDERPDNMRNTAPVTRACRQTGDTPPLAQGLAWLSIALGVIELCAPRAVSRAAGLNVHSGVVRLCGVRELACGIAILASSNPQRPLWARLAGDVLDLGTTAYAAQRGHTRNTRRALIAAGAVAGIGALDLYAARTERAERTARCGHSEMRDYSGHSGFPQAPDQMRGAARADFDMPADMRTPDALRPYPGS